MVKKSIIINKSYVGVFNCENELKNNKQKNTFQSRPNFFIIIFCFLLIFTQY